MERIYTDDPRDAEIADNILSHLRHSLQMLASPAKAQLNHFPPNWVVLTDELVLDFDAWYERIASYWKLSKEQTTILAQLDEFFSKKDISSNGDFWIDEALTSDTRWEDVREMAKAALVSFEWPIEIPPPAREENGMVFDHGSYFIKGKKPC